MRRSRWNKLVVVLGFMVLLGFVGSSSASLKLVYYSGGWNVRDLLAGDFTAIAEFPSSGLYSSFRVWYARENDLGIEYYVSGAGWQTRSGIVTDKTYTTLAGSPAADQVFAGNDSGALDRITWTGSAWSKKSLSGFTKIHKLAYNGNSSYGAWVSGLHSNGNNYVMHPNSSFSDWYGANVGTHQFTALADEGNSANWCWASGDGTGVYRIYYSGGWKYASIGVSAWGGESSAEISYINSTGFDDLAPIFTKAFGESFSFWGLNENGVYYVAYFAGQGYKARNVSNAAGGHSGWYVDITYDNEGSHQIWAAWKDPNDPSQYGVDRLWWDGSKWRADYYIHEDFDMLCADYQQNNSFWGATQIPEPATVGLVAMGLVGVLVRKR